MKLLNPTNQELNAAFAEKVCGLHCIPDVAYGWTDPDGNRRASSEWPYDYCSDANAVLPWLEKPMFGEGKQFSVYIRFTAVNQYWHVDIMDRISYGRDCRMFHGLPGRSFAKAAVIALLRAHGVEIELS